MKDGIKNISIAYKEWLMEDGGDVAAGAMGSAENMADFQSDPKLVIYGLWKNDDKKKRKYFKRQEEMEDFLKNNKGWTEIKETENIDERMINPGSVVYSQPSGDRDAHWIVIQEPKDYRIELAYKKEEPLIKKIPFDPTNPAKIKNALKYAKNVIKKSIDKYDIQKLIEL